MHKSQSVETTEEKQSARDGFFEFGSSRKTVLRWDLKRGLWRQLCLWPTGDGYYLSSIFLRRCIVCGAQHLTQQVTASCTECGVARRARMRPISSPAHLAVYRAVKSGELQKLDGSVPCKDCGQPAAVYDHREYSKPLDVDPVCNSCNKLRGPAKEFEALVLRRKSANA